MKCTFISDMLSTELNKYEYKIKQHSFMYSKLFCLHILNVDIPVYEMFALNNIYSIMPYTNIFFIKFISIQLHDSLMHILLHFVNC